MCSFQIAIKKPTEIVPRLGKPTHWKEGRSAFELATSWMKCGGIPATVQTVLDQADEWRNATFLEGIFERETDLPGRGRPSQTDLLAFIKLRDGNAILGIEGKVDEPFGSRVAEWLTYRDGTAPVEGLEQERQQNRRRRLEGLCATLDIDVNSTLRLFYQLIHRVCASVYEAKRFGYERAGVLVHSFGDGPVVGENFDHFAEFAHGVGMPVAAPGTISSPRVCEGVEVRLGWVADKISAMASAAMDSGGNGRSERIRTSGP